MQRTYYTDADLLADYLEHGDDENRPVTPARLDEAAAMIASKSRYGWNEREALGFLATVSDDERRSADDAALNHDDATMAASVGYHACRVAFWVVYHAAVLDLQAELARSATLAAHVNNGRP